MRSSDARDGTTLINCNLTRQFNFQSDGKRFQEVPEFPEYLPIRACQPEASLYHRIKRVVATLYHQNNTLGNRALNIPSLVVVPENLDSYEPTYVQIRCLFSWASVTRETNYL